MASAGGTPPSHAVACPPMTADAPPVSLVRGDDAVLVGAGLQRVVDRLVGDADRSLVVEELAGEDYELAAVVNAARTPPFLTDRRVVVARDVHRFSAEQLAPVVEYLADPLPTTALVLVWSSGRVPKALLDAVKAAGGANVDTGAPTGKARQGWLEERFERSGVRLDSAARRLVVERLGEDVGRLDNLLRTLASIHGGSVRVGPAEVEPYLGEAGGVPPWELTDAIDKGDAPAALDRLRRMMVGGERHPLQILATLHGHYRRLLLLDGVEVRDERAAAEVLGLRGSTFPARKALSQVRRLGHEGVVQAYRLLARADLDVRGATDVPDDVVLEVLVARLSRLAARRV
ncbi:MAG TPA: DNA polymerase III subunit delta [Acidimicrobiales bacterium]|jgi:DNA polymerase-3 subunit delta